MIRVRRPAVAGLFYPSQPAALLTAVQQLLPASEARAAVGAIVPHAGYQYSGRTAGAVLAGVELPRRCVVLAPNHTGAGHAKNGGSVFAVGVYRTPLGDIPVDETLAAALLARCPLLEDDPEAHRTEHAIEVILPFLAARRPDVTVLPVLVAWSDWTRTRQLAEALADLVRGASEPVLLLASSDMNHYERADVGKRKDDMALECIARLDGEGLLETTRRHRITMCGRTPAAAVLHASRRLGAMQGQLVHYSHSGEATHDDSSVVGYAGVLIR